MLDAIKNIFTDIYVEIKDFLISIYNTIFSFLAQYLGENFARLTLVALAFLLIMLILNAIINANK